MVKLRHTLILYMCVKMMETLGQFGKLWGDSGGTRRPQLLGSCRREELVQRRLPGEDKRVQHIMNKRLWDFKQMACPLFYFVKSVSKYQQV